LQGPYAGPIIFCYQ